MDFTKLVNEMSDEQLAELREAANSAAEGRRKKFTLGDIRQGMTDEQKAAARAEIDRVLRQG